MTRTKTRNKVDNIRRIIRPEHVIIIVLLAVLLGFGSPMMFFGPVFMVLVLILLVWLIVSLVKHYD